MRPAAALIGVLLVVSAAAASPMRNSGSSDRLLAVHVVPGAPANAATDVALGETGDVAVAWVPYSFAREAVVGALKLAERRGARWTTSTLATFVRPTEVAVAHDADNKPLVAWSTSRGVFVSRRDSKVERVIAGPAGGVDATRLADGRLLVVGYFPTGRSGRSVAAISDGVSWQTHDLGVSSSSPRSAAYGDSGFAIVRTDERGGLILEAFVDVDSAPKRYPLGALGAGAALATRGDRTVFVLFVLGAAGRRGVVGYATLREGLFTRRVLETPEFMCDPYSAKGVGFVGSKPRFALGGGCDVGWGIHDASYRSLEPAELRNHPRLMQAAPLYEVATAGGRTALLVARLQSPHRSGSLVAAVIGP